MYKLTAVLGVLLTVSPIILKYSDMRAEWLSVVIGLVTLLASGIEWFEHDKENWEYWLMAVLGCVIAALPFVLHLQRSPVESIGLLILGSFLAVIAGEKFITNLL